MKPVKQSWILAGGIISALASSLCCIGPFVAVVLGLGSFAAAGWFEKWRPFFLIVTLGLLAASWALTIRARRCVSRVGQRWTFGMLIFGTVLVSMLAFFPQLVATAARES